MDSGLGADDLPGQIAGYDALVVRSTKVRREVFDAADRLALVIRAGAGTNTIDTDTAASRGVLVANVPGRNAAAVAELTMGLLLAIDRRIPDNVADLRAGPLGQEGLRQGRRRCSARRWASSASGRSASASPSGRRRSASTCRRWPSRAVRRTPPNASRSSGSSCATRCPTCSAPATSSPCTCRRRRRPSTWWTTSSCTT